MSQFGNKFCISTTCPCAVMPLKVRSGLPTRLYSLGVAICIVPHSVDDSMGGKGLLYLMRVSDRIQGIWAGNQTLAVSCCTHLYTPYPAYQEFLNCLTPE